jgi:hypothetical protein
LNDVALMIQQETMMKKRMMMMVMDSVVAAPFEGVPRTQVCDYANEARQVSNT